MKTSRVAANKISLRKETSVQEEIQLLNEQISQRAYYRYLERGGAGGHELEDWLLAEQELTRRPPVSVVEKDHKLSISVGIPGAKTSDLDVRIGHDALIVSALMDGLEEDAKESIVHRSDFRTGRVVQPIPLPKPVDTGRIRARYANGILQITAPISDSTPKARSPRNTRRPKGNAS